MKNKVFLIESFPLSTREKEHVAALLAALCFCLDPEVDEFEAFDHIHEYLKERPLSLEAMPEIASMARATKFLEGKDRWN